MGGAPGKHELVGNLFVRVQIIPKSASALILRTVNRSQMEQEQGNPCSDLLLTHFMIDNSAREKIN